MDALLEEFVAGWTAGEPTDLDALLSRAGPEADELARLIDTFLERAPRREPSQASKDVITVLATRLETDPPLLTARVAARKRVREVVDAIVTFCGLPPEADPLVRSYYQQLEGGLLNPAGVSERIWSVLADAVAPAAKKLAFEGFTPKLFKTEAAFNRLATENYAGPAGAMAAPAPAQPADEITSEVRALFTAAETD
ncbi:MAG TPA: hypothetical protein VH063_13485 [Gaiellaceae bacterium]|nr:hypothetical protein [Gaiellaceae bacterium]